MPLAVLKFETLSFWPALLAGATGLALVAYAYTRGLKRDPRFGRPLLAGLRLAAVLMAFLSLLHPAWVAEREDPERPRLAILLDNSLSMQQPAGSGAVTTRYDLARAVLADSILPTLSEDFDFAVFDVTGKQIRLDELPPAPDAKHSPLTSTLLNVQRAFEQDLLRGIVLLSDGREIAPPGDSERVEALRTPVYAVDLAAGGAGAGRGADLSVQAVIANEEAMVDNSVNVTVLLASDPSAEPATVELLLSEGDLPVGRTLLRWEPGVLNRQADMQFVARNPGLHSLTVQARRVDRDGRPLFDGEPDLANNWAHFPVTVHPDRLSVLYVDGVLRWESKFIRETLDLDPDVNLLTAVRTTPREAAARSEGIFTKAQLANVQVVILGDIEASFFDAIELAHLADWVLESGGGLLMTGGYLSFGADGFAQTSLARALPIVFPEPERAQVEMAFNLRLTEDGFRHPVFHVTGDPSRDRSIWHALPKLTGCVRIPSVKPGARVLAVNPEASDERNPRGLPLLVEHQAGKGRAMVLAADSTWQWRTIVGGYTQDISFYRKFWSQMVRYLAGEDRADASPLLRVATDREAYRPGDPIELLIHLAAPGSEAGSAADRDYRVRALARGETGARTRLELTPAGPGRYRAVHTPSTAGRVTFDVIAEPLLSGRAPRHRSRTLTVQVAHPDRERHETRPDAARLQRLAQSTGGRFSPPAEIADWPLSAEPAMVKKVSVTGIWHHPAWAVVLLLLVCTEWVLRRLARLA